MEGKTSLQFLTAFIFMGFCMQVLHAACPAHPLTPNAAWDVNATSHSTMSNYSCETGFVFNGSASEFQVFQCLVTDLWSPDPTNYQCEGQPCTANTFSSENTVIADKSGLPANTSTSTTGTELDVSCLSGYVYNDSSIRKQTRCGGDLAWWPDILNCEPVQCPEIFNETFSNASTTDHYFGVEVNYTCWPGYFFPDGTLWRVMECDQYGRWTEVIPGCVDEVPDIAVDVVTVKQEAEDALSFATIAMIAIGLLLLAIIILDGATLSRHLLRMKTNLISRWPYMCSKRPTGSEEELRGSLMDFRGSAIQKSTISLGRGKVTPAPSIVDMQHPPPYEEQDPLFLGGAVGGAAAVLEMETKKGHEHKVDLSDEIEVINETELEHESNQVSEPAAPPSAASVTASAPGSAHRTRLKSARTSIQRAVQLVTTTVRLQRAAKASYESSSLPLGADNFGKPVEKRPISPVKEEYNSEPSETEYEDDSEEEEEDGDN